MKGNCGVEALEQIKKVDTVSAFTLVQMAKENGLRLFIFKVEPKDIPLVQRPAIFHTVSPDHFVTVEKGDSLPELEFSGYVLSAKPMGTPVPFSEAKQITGDGPLIPIVTAIVNVVGWVGTAISTVGSAIGGAIAGSLSAAGLSTAAAWVGTLSPMMLGGSAIGATYGGITGGWKGALKGGLLGGALGGVAGQFGAGFSGAGQGATLGSQLASGAKAVWTGGKSLVGQPASTGGPGGAIAGGNVSYATTPAGYGGSVTVPGVQGAQQLSSLGSPGAAGIAGAGSTNYASGLNVVGTNASKFRPGDFKGFEGIGSTIEGKAKSTLFETGAGLLAGQVAGERPQPPSMANTVSGVGESYNRIRSLLGSDVGLPQVTEKELSRLVDTPLDQLSQDFTFETDRTYKRINDVFDTRAQSLGQQYAAQGRDPLGSSDYQKQLNDIESERAEALQFAEQDVRNQAMANAIESKQWALGQALSQNQFDEGLAFELAKALGTDEQLRYAIEVQDYDTFQQIIADLLTSGFGYA